TVMSAADLVVSRAGAGTLAELARCATPAVLVPFPHAADNHQAANAAAFVAAGGGHLVPQDEIDRLDRLVPALLNDENALAAHRAALGVVDRVNAVTFMVDDLEMLTARPGASPAW